MSSTGVVCDGYRLMLMSGQALKRRTGCPVVVTASLVLSMAGVPQGGLIEPPAGPSSSEIEDQMRCAGPGDADHHAVAGLPLLLVEDRVAVIGHAFEYRCLARAAGPLGAGGEDTDSCLLDDGQDGSVRGNGHSQRALRQMDLEGPAEHGFGEWLCGKAFNVQDGRPQCDWPRMDTALPSPVRAASKSSLHGLTCSDGNLRTGSAF